MGSQANDTNWICCLQLAGMKADALSLDWDSLPELVMHNIFKHVPLRFKGRCRQISKYWMSVLDPNLKVRSLASVYGGLSEFQAVEASV